MNKEEMYEENQARYAGDKRPKVIEPEIKYPSYSDYANEGPANPVYTQDRGYVEHRD